MKNSNTIGLTDIKDIEINLNLDIYERLELFKSQVKTPYRYKCGEVTINTKYKSETTLENSLKEYLTRETNQ